MQTIHALDSLFQSMQQCPLAAGLEGDWRFHLGKEGLLCDAAKQQKQPPHFVPQWLSLLPSMPLLWHRGSTLLYTSSFSGHAFATRCRLFTMIPSFASRTFCRTNVTQSSHSCVNFTSTVLPYIEVNPPGTTLPSHFNPIAFLWTLGKTHRQHLSPWGA